MKAGSKEFESSSKRWRALPRREGATPVVDVRVRADAKLEDLLGFLEEFYTLGFEEMEIAPRSD